MLASCRALVQACRPQQWIKNLLVFFPFLFAVRVAWSLSDLGPVPGLLIRLAVVFVALCAVASAVYLINDLSDKSSDRLHPLKSKRPIASGMVPAPVAVAAMVLLMAIGIAILAWLDLILVWVILAYVAINVAYSFGAKKIVLVDVLAVASGYVIRVAIGAAAIGVVPSPWLYAATGAGALFIVLGRRYAEVRLAGDQASSQRPVLDRYSGPFIGQLLTISATAAWLSYTLYTVEANNLPENDSMLLTIPLVTVGLFRYLYLLNHSDAAESPEQLIISDLPMVLSIMAWMTASVLVLLFNG
ncbi:MAG: decaprenyl-phosphate phosphoribosyltransferase [SAR202 cluster bacterium Io17-Chloro-G9]|nr:MAG: decaprenyl-phosphate phosphoribosyltransferase [SAR202 cluster bacterium Io17-Chloro-G9]